MKGILKYLLKALLIVLYPVFVGATVALAITTYSRTNELTAARQSYEQVHAKVGFEGAVETDLSKGIQLLGDRLKESTDKLADAEKKLADINTEGGLKKEGYGQITGEILLFSTFSGEAVTQYQTVCAEQAGNEAQIYCASVSVINKNYTLVLPVGEYFVYAQIEGEGLDPRVATYKAYFTQFVACKLKDPAAVCAEELSTKKERVKVENGKTVENANPIDWRIGL